MQPLDAEVALAFRDQLRAGRIGALQDAEGYQDIVFVVERLGNWLAAVELGPDGCKEMGLGANRDRVCSLASLSPLATTIPKQNPHVHTDFRALYRIVQQVRNEAFHEGAYARHLAGCAIELALVLEDALVSSTEYIRDYVVKNPTTAALWHPLSFVRLVMLENSFSYLPVYARGSWKLVWEYDVARYLRNAETRKERLRRLQERLEDATGSGNVALYEAHLAEPDETVAQVLERLEDHPHPVVLLINPDHPSELRGIATPFDLL